MYTSTQTNIHTYILTLLTYILTYSSSSPPKASKKRKAAAKEQYVVEVEDEGEDGSASSSQSFTVPYPKHPLFRDDQLYKVIQSLLWISNITMN